MLVKRFLIGLLFITRPLYMFVRLLSALGWMAGQLDQWFQWSFSYISPCVREEVCACMRRIRDTRTGDQYYVPELRSGCRANCISDLRVLCAELAATRSRSVISMTLRQLFFPTALFANIPIVPALIQTSIPNLPPCSIALICCFSFFWVAPTGEVKISPT